jgi:transporter family-2 protein
VARRSHGRLRRPHDHVRGPADGTTATVAVFLVGQFAAAVVVDRYGLFGLDRIAVGWPRMLGLVLLAVGASLTLKR